MENTNVQDEENDHFVTSSKKQVEDGFMGAGLLGFGMVSSLPCIDYEEGGYSPMDDGFCDTGHHIDSTSSDSSHHEPQNTGVEDRSYSGRENLRNENGKLIRPSPLDFLKGAAMLPMFTSPENNRERRPSLWRSVSQKVLNGELLVRSSPSHDESTATPVARKLKRRQRIETAFRKAMNFSWYHFLLLLLFYMTLSVASFSFLVDNWSILDSCYFAVVTFTTIGYGDLVPSSIVGRAIACFIALSGATSLGIAIGMLGNNMIVTHERTVNRTSSLAETLVLDLFSTKEERKEIRRVIGRGASSDSILDEEQAKRELIEFRNNWRTYLHCLREFILVVAILLIFSFLDAGDLNAKGKWDLGSALYFSIVTATTLGYGDVAPHTERGRLIALVFIPLIVVAMGHWLRTVAACIVEARQSRFRKQMGVQRLSLSLLEAMDHDGDGKVSAADFLEFMLVAMDKVDQGLILELRAHFARLDKENRGYLSKDDLVAAARRELYSPKRKLELARYKHQLMKSGSKVSD